MKKISTLILISLFTSSLMAQIVLQHRLDTIANQAFNTDTLVTTSYYIYEYDAIGIQTQEKYMILNEDGGMDIWKQIDYEHNANKKITEWILSTVSDDNYPNVDLFQKGNLTYNADGLIVLKTIDLRNLETAEWELNDKTEYEYNESKQISIKTKSYLENISGEWVPDIKDEYIYDDDQLFSDIHSDWQDEQWSANSKNEYSYREDSKISQKIMFDKFGLPDWVEEWKVDYIYDDSGNKTQEIKYSFSETKEWVKATKYAFSYDAFNNMSEYVVYDWAVDVWDQKEKYTWEVNTNYWYENLVLPYFDDGKALIDDGIHLYPMGNYKSFFKNMLNGYQSQKWLNNSWTDISQSSFRYSQFYTSIDNVSKNIISIFPNPTSDFIKFNIGDKTPSMTFKLFDLNGKLVLIKEVTSANRISVFGFKNGMYFYQLTNNTKVWSGKIILQ